MAISDLQPCILNNCILKNCSKICPTCRHSSASMPAGVCRIELLHHLLEPGRLHTLYKGNRSAGCRHCMAGDMDTGNSSCKGYYRAPVPEHLPKSCLETCAALVTPASTSVPECQQHLPTHLSPCTNCKAQKVSAKLKHLISC